MTKRQKFFSALGKFLKDLFTKNILLKIVALVFALLLWGYVLSEVKPKYVKRVDDVVITLRNESSLREKGWVVVKDGDYKTDVNIEAAIDRHSMLNDSNVLCYVDLEKIQLSDQDPDQKTVTLDVMTTIPDYGVLKSVSVDQISLVIERTWTGKPLAATVRTEGSLPDIVQAGDALPAYFVCIPPEQVTVPALSGLKSEIDRITRAEVTIDLSVFDQMDLDKIPGTYAFDLPVEFFDAEGNTIDSASTRDVKVTVDKIEIRRYKEVPIELNTAVGETFDTERFSYACEIADDSKKTIRIYGDTATLAQIESVKTELITVDRTDADTETVSAKVILLPKVKTEEDTVVPVRITVTNRMAEDVEYEIPIMYTGLEEGFILLDKPDTVIVKVSGLIDVMESFNQKWIAASVDLDDLGEGTFAVPITLLFREINLYVQDYRIEETGGGQPVIRITYVTDSGTTYVFTLHQKTVSVTLKAIEIETPED